MRASWFAAVLFAFLGLIAAPATRAENAAETFVQMNIDKSYAILNDRGLDAAERETRFANQIRSAVDTKRVALFTLGPYARGVSKEDLDAYTIAFDDFLTAILHQGLSRYGDRSLRVTGSMSRAADDVVVAVLVPPGARDLEELHIAFRVRRSDRGDLVLTDFQVEGAWLALTERADFISYLTQHGGSLMELSKELQVRARMIRSDLAARQ